MFALLTGPAAAPPPPAPVARLRVRSADELRRALRETRDRSVMLDASALNCVLCVDARRGRLEVQGAATWSGLASRMGATGGPLERWTRTNPLPGNIAETLSRDEPGPDGLPFASYVESVALVTLDGELRRVDRQRDARLFRVVAGGQGVFGMLYSVTLRLDALLEAAAKAPPSQVVAANGDRCPRGTTIALDVLVPSDQAAAYVTDACMLATERRLTLQRVTTRALRAGAETALGWATRDWTGISLATPLGATLGASVHVAEIRTLLLGAALARGGSFPARMASHASRAQLSATYPQLPEFLSEKRRYDPGERLQNDWYRGVSALLRSHA